MGVLLLDDSVMRESKQPLMSIVMSLSLIGCQPSPAAKQDMTPPQPSSQDRHVNPRATTRAQPQTPTANDLPKSDEDRALLEQAEDRALLEQALVKNGGVATEALKKHLRVPKDNVAANDPAVQKPTPSTTESYQTEVKLIHLKLDGPPDANFKPKMVEREIKKRLAALRACYDREVRRSETPPRGQIEVRFTVTGQGIVDGTSAVENTSGSKAMPDCVTSTIRRFRFRPAPTTGQTYRARFSFTAQVAQKRKSGTVGELK